MKNSIIYRHCGKDGLYKIWHEVGEQVMLIYMYSDGGSIVMRDKIYPIKKGVLCFIGAKKSHYTMPDNPKNYERSKIHINTDEFLKVLPLYSANNSFDKIFTAESAVFAEIPPKEQAEVESLIYEIKKYEEEERYADVVLISCFMRLLIYLEKYSTDKYQSPADMVSKGIAYINEHISGEITIDDICDAVHMSKFYFCRKFKRVLGVTVMEYILNTRLTLAKKMLADTTMSVSEISERCGFSSISYFCRVFKEDMGLTALCYRKAFKNKMD